MNKITSSSRVIQIKDGVIGPVEPLPVTVPYKKIGDYPGVPKVYTEVAKHFSSTLLMGPPICDELISLVQHIYTEEEASIVRHLKPYRIKTAKAIARAENRPVEEVSTILEYLANEKHTLLSYGPLDNRRYLMLAMVGGVFEMVQMGKDVGAPYDTLLAWRRRFAELFEELFDTGYWTDYTKHSTSLLRTLPIGQSIESNPIALPSDRLEEVFDRYNTFAVGRCGCRKTKQHVGEDCGRPLDVCTAMGDYAESIINKGFMRRVEKKEIIEIKKEAESKGLVHWLANVDEISGRFGNFSCSCCGCCCAVFRTITEFNMPGLVAQPHFIPSFNSIECDSCGLCAKRCPMGAITVDTKNEILMHQTKRCIGCGQCVLACEKKHAIQMGPSSNFKRPANTLPMMGIKMLPRFLRMTLNVWKERR